MVFQDVQSFSVIKDGPTIQDYKLKIADQIVENINLRRIIDCLP